MTEATRKSPTDARQGERGKGVSTVLAISLALSFSALAFMVGTLVG